jgi:transcriptional regulator with XRE-family HTH domain
VEDTTGFSKYHPGIAVVSSRPWSPALGSHLKQARLRAELSRAEVAAELEVSQESVRRWEQGGSKPSSAAVAAYLRVVGSDVVPLEQVVPGEQGEPGRPDVGQAIRRRRRGLGLTQAECAVTIGVAQPTLAGWEIGRARPGRDLAAAIAAFLEEPVGRVEAMLHQPLSVEMARWPTFGRIIGERRLSLQIDRNELAARMHVSARTIAAWETGEKVPNNTHLARLAEVLGVAPAVLVSALPERRPTSELGRLIHRRQRLLGLDRDDIAAACDVTPVTVGRWIWGHHAPTDANVEHLAKVLELDARIVRTAVEVDGGRTAGATAAVAD